MIVTNSDGQFTTASGKQNGVESMIQHILMKDQINYIKEQGKWYYFISVFYIGLKNGKRSPQLKRMFLLNLLKRNIQMRTVILV